MEELMLNVNRKAIEKEYNSFLPLTDAELLLVVACISGVCGACCFDRQYLMVFADNPELPIVSIGEQTWEDTDSDLHMLLVSMMTEVDTNLSERRND